MSKADNLALACPECNYHKGTNLTGVDPDSGSIVRLFHPRQDRWKDHFKMAEGVIVGISPVGRTSVWLLEMNRPDRLQLRKVLLRFGRGG